MAWFEHGKARIYYEEDGSGDPILLLPGFAGNIEELSGVREALIVAGYRIIAADLPGSGRSEPQPRAYTASYYEDDARSLEALLQHLSIASAHLIGFSDGGEVSLLLAALTPERARSVVTWGAVGTINDPNGQLRDIMYNVVDQPIPPMQSFSQYLITTYGKTNARAMTQSVVEESVETLKPGQTSSVTLAPPSTARRSSTVTRNPARAR